MTGIQFDKNPFERYILIMERDPSIRKIEDTQTLKALAHPLRMDLLEAVTFSGPLTATEASEIVGESPANCSWHLRQLAKCGFLEEVPDAKGRQRPWRRIAGGMQWDDDADDPEVEDASRALTEVFVNREVRLIQQAMRRSHPPGWAESLIATQSITWLTADEFEALSADLTEVLMRYRSRAFDPSQRPPDSRPIRLLALGAPDDGLQSSARTGEHHA